MKNLNERPINEPERSRQEIMEEVRYVRQNVYLMGANDAEIREIDAVIGLEEKGEIEPLEALSRAEKILAGKQDYH